MNTAATSRKELLCAAKQIAAEQGISKISVRTVAAKCGVSVGALYNYFPNKSDLILAVIEDFWESALVSVQWEKLGHCGFLKCFETVFFALSLSVAEFQHNWVSQLSLLESEEKRMGRVRKANYFERIRRIFVSSLANDPNIHPDRWTDTFCIDAFAAFAFDSLLVQMTSNQPDCALLIEIFERCLYPAESYQTRRLDR